MSKPSIAVIGAGLSGVVAAREFTDLANVTVFEKARGVSGRMATRYADPYQFDHGAQFFIAKSDEFKEYIKPLIEDGVIVRWDANFVEFDNDKVISGRQWDEDNPHYVGTPKMNQIVKHLAADLDLKLQTRIVEIKDKENQKELVDEEGNSQGTYDWVIVAIPAEQAKDLLPDNFPHKNIAEKTKMLGAHSLMLGFEEALPLEWQAAFVQNADISWISINSTKPGRPQGYSMLVHATNKWSEEHIEDDLEQAKEYIIKETSRITGVNVSIANHQAIHRWRYANASKHGGEKSYFDEKSKIGICGDWLIQGRVEAAYLSAVDLSNKIKQEL